MKIDHRLLAILATIVPAIVLWSRLLWKMKIWVRIMDIFREGLPFERAIESLKQGKSIRRKRSNFGLTKMVVSARGEQKEKFCEFDLKERKG